MTNGNQRLLNAFICRTFITVSFLRAWVSHEPKSSIGATIPLQPSSTTYTQGLTTYTSSIVKPLPSILNIFVGPHSQAETQTTEASPKNLISTKNQIEQFPLKKIDTIALTKAKEESPLAGSNRGPQDNDCSLNSYSLALFQLS